MINTQVDDTYIYDLENKSGNEELSCSRDSFLWHLCLWSEMEEENPETDHNKWLIFECQNTWACDLIPLAALQIVLSFSMFLRNYKENKYIYIQFALTMFK